MVIRRNKGGKEERKEGGKQAANKKIRIEGRKEDGGGREGRMGKGGEGEGGREGKKGRGKMGKESKRGGLKIS